MTENFKKKLSLMIAEFFFCGRFPFAPGTAGSLASLLIWIPCIYLAFSQIIITIALVVLFFVGVWASEYAIEFYNKEDPKQVVIDEVVGQGIVFLCVAPSLVEFFFAFVLFRIFDILKPWPIKNVERAFPNKYGIMLDDVVAGIFAAVTLLIFKQISFYF